MFYFVALTEIEAGQFLPTNCNKLCQMVRCHYSISIFVLLFILYPFACMKPYGKVVYLRGFFVFDKMRTYLHILEHIFTIF